MALMALMALPVQPDHKDPQGRQVPLDRRERR
jgi:hypothetical protein